MKTREGMKYYPMETYESYDGMQKRRPLSIKINEISRFENFDITRFFHKYTNETIITLWFSLFYSLNACHSGTVI